MQHTILIFGATGGIGGAVARYFAALGCQLILPVRDLGKPEAIELATLPHARMIACDPGEKSSLRAMLTLLKDEGITPDIVFQATGTFLWDDGHPGSVVGGSPKEQRAYTKPLLEAGNLETKRLLIELLDELFDTSRIGLYLVSSHAATFGPDHPFRNGPFKQEEYCAVMRAVSDLGATTAATNRYRFVRVLETDLVDTGMTRKAFPPERAGNIDWNTVQKPDEYVKKVLSNTEL